ncbi:HGGxSTG domain-containing protein [Alphaproteobacteria bacterium]|nr:HGGxSTG domain-containing protein [Alphaproteobacteria bacterium]
MNGRCRLHGGKSTGPRTAEGRARIAAAQFKHGNRSKAAIAAQRAKAARGRAIRAELAALEAKVIGEGLLTSNWRDAYRI